MKKTLLLFSLVVVALICGFNSDPENSQPVNALLGDISFIKRFGVPPTSKTDEDLRIRTHLEYVEHLLRKKEVTGLSEEQRSNRERLLGLLHEYWMQGIFPRNVDHPNTRVPCFIDDEGRICAVGYLVEKTAGRSVAKKINSQFKYSLISEMHDATLDAWIKNSGLTKEECGMIQPEYAQRKSSNYIPPKIGIPSALLSGVNVTMTIINGSQIARDRNNNIAPLIGITTGLTQLVVGMADYAQVENEGSVGLFINDGRKNLNLINIGVGTATMILSSYNLLSKKAKKPNAVAWNVYSYPTSKKSVGIGVQLTKKI